MPDFQRLTKLIVKHALGYFDIAPLALNPERRSYKCPNSRRGRGRPRHNVGWASPPASPFDFEGGMASAFAQASPFAKGFGGQVGGHVRAVPNWHLPQPTRGEQN